MNHRGITVSSKTYGNIMGSNGKKNNSGESNVSGWKSLEILELAMKV